MSELPSKSVLEHIVDVHCHPTDAPSISEESIARLPIKICAMSSMEADQNLVRDLALANPAKVIPCFGHHPWFSHRISISPSTSKDDHYRSLFLRSPSPPQDHITAFYQLLPSLPDPVPIMNILLELRHNLETFPDAMLGEVGLDRSFRVPYDSCADQRRLTPFVVPLDHQMALLEAQLDIAIEMGRNISIHSVKSQLATSELLDKMKTRHGDKWLRINLDLHSCTVSPETWRDIEAWPLVFSHISKLTLSIAKAPKCVSLAFNGHQQPFTES
ncbi:hypothetical protein H0H92_013096 [Tricholoma furcatifolium]|nr:hypothetical protein H0H92_013096 [Tricholoma furcatifolium]